MLTNRGGYRRGKTRGQELGMALHNVWIATASDGIVRADQVIGGHTRRRG